MVSPMVNWTEHMPKARSGYSVIERESMPVRIQLTQITRGGIMEISTSPTLVFNIIFINKTCTHHEWNKQVCFSTCHTARDMHMKLFHT